MFNVSINDIVQYILDRNEQKSVNLEIGNTS